MLTILLHSSKTMRPSSDMPLAYQQPKLLSKANELAGYLRTLTTAQLQEHMHLSAAKAEQTHELLNNWSNSKDTQRPAIDAFLGDIYSGLQVQTLSDSDRVYANEHLLILSGLYGGLRALDSVYPYRLEMGYKLPDTRYKNLYTFWGDSVAKLIPNEEIVINLSAVEYTKSVLPYISNTIITPKFLTVTPKTNEPTFVTVHAKIARGAFAHWLIKNRIQDVDKLTGFNELGYSLDAKLSSQNEPVFVCQDFKGLGLSVRLT